MDFQKITLMPPQRLFSSDNLIPPSELFGLKNVSKDKRSKLQNKDLFLPQNLNLLVKSNFTKSVLGPPKNIYKDEHGHITGKKPKVNYPFIVEKPTIIPSSKSPFHNSRNGKEIDSIVLHNTAGRNMSAEKWADFFANEHKKVLDDGTVKIRKVSTHYIIDKEGRIAQSVDDDKTAWHAGSANKTSIGIDFVNGGQRNKKVNGKKVTTYDTYTNEQYESAAKLMAHLMTKYGIPLENLIGHRHVADNKVDPSDNFDWNRLKNKINQIIAFQGI